MKVHASKISFLQPRKGDLYLENRRDDMGSNQPHADEDNAGFPVKDDCHDDDHHNEGCSPKNIQMDIEKEVQRLLCLRSFHVLQEEEYQECHQRFTSLAARYFRAPLAKIILVDMERCWSLACTGDDHETRETERWGSIYDEAVKDPAPLFCVKDMESDLHYQKMKSLSQLDEYRFFASTPLISHDGHRIGVLAVMDLDPRPAPTMEDVIFLKEIASSLMDLLGLKRSRLLRGVNQNCSGLLRSARFVRECLKGVRDDPDLRMVLAEHHQEMIHAACANAQVVCTAFEAQCHEKSAAHHDMIKQHGLCTTTTTTKNSKSVSC